MKKKALFGALIALALAALCALPVVAYATDGNEDTLNCHDDVVINGEGNHGFDRCWVFDEDGDFVCDYFGTDPGCFENYAIYDAEDEVLTLHGYINLVWGSIDIYNDDLTIEVEGEAVITDESYCTASIDLFCGGTLTITSADDEFASLKITKVPTDAPVFSNEIAVIDACGGACLIIEDMASLELCNVQTNAQGVCGGDPTLYCIHADNVSISNVAYLSAQIGLCDQTECWPWPCFDSPISAQVIGAKEVSFFYCPVVELASADVDGCTNIGIFAPVAVNLTQSNITGLYIGDVECVDGVECIEEHECYGSYGVYTNELNVNDVDSMFLFSGCYAGGYIAQLNLPESRKLVGSMDIYAEENFADAALNEDGIPMIKDEIAYTITLADIPVPAPEPQPTPEPSKTPETGDATPIALIAGMIAAAGAIALVARKRQQF